MVATEIQTKEEVMAADIILTPGEGIISEAVPEEVMVAHEGGTEVHPVAAGTVNLEAATEPLHQDEGGTEALKHKEQEVMAQLNMEQEAISRLQILTEATHSQQAMLKRNQQQRARMALQRNKLQIHIKDTVRVQHKVLTRLTLPQALMGHQQIHMGQRLSSNSTGHTEQHRSSLVINFILFCTCLNSGIGANPGQNRALQHRKMALGRTRTDH